MFSNSFTKLASVYLGGCFLNLSVLTICFISNISHSLSFGNIPPFSTSSSSLHSIYTLRKPSNLIISHSAINLFL